MPPTPLGPALPPHLAAEPSEHFPTSASYELKGHEGPVYAVRFNSQGTYCMSCGKDRTLRLWNPHTGRLVKTYTGHGYDVRDVTVTKDNSKFASCGGDKQVFVWDVGSGKIIRKLRGHDAPINAITQGAGDEVLVTGSYDQAVKVWDCRSRSFDPVQVMTDASDSVTSVTTNTAGGRAEVAAASVDGGVRRYDIRMGRLFTDALHVPVTHLAVSRDGAMLLAACMDSCIRLLDRAEGDLLMEFRGHKHASTRIECCLSPTDAHVFGASEDGRVCIWDLASGEMVESHQAHSDSVCSMALHPEGSTLCTSSVDGLIKVWV
ncbi:hypothetical protein ACKKBG_A01335 [Auxenochlorella protothecoides x Auxenochlorella symbiontica]